MVLNSEAKKEEKCHGGPENRMLVVVLTVTACTNSWRLSWEALTVCGFQSLLL